MASSVLFDLGGSRGITSGDNPYSTSVTNEATIGYLEFLESDKLKSEKSEQDGSKVRYKILITLEDENNQLCRFVNLV